MLIELGNVIKHDNKRKIIRFAPDYRYFFPFAFLFSRAAAAGAGYFISILFDGGGDGAASNFIRYDLTASRIVIEVYTRIERFIGSDEVGERCHIETSDDIMNNNKKNGKKFPTTRKNSCTRTSTTINGGKIKRGKVFEAIGASLC